MYIYMNVYINETRFGTRDNGGEVIESLRNWMEQLTLNRFSQICGVLLITSHDIIDSKILINAFSITGGLYKF